MFRESTGNLFHTVKSRLSYWDAILSVSPCAVLLPADPCVQRHCLQRLGCKRQCGFC